MEEGFDPISRKRRPRPGQHARTSPIDWRHVFELISAARQGHYNYPAGASGSTLSHLSGDAYLNRWGRAGTFWVYTGDQSGRDSRHSSSSSPLSVRRRSCPIWIVWVRHQNRQRQALKPKVIRVALVEDRREIREALVAIIDGTEGFRCTGSFRTMEQALAEIGRELPDVVLSDIGLPGMSGIEGIGHSERALSRRCSS